MSSQSSCKLISLLLVCLVSALFVIFIYVCAWKRRRETPDGVLLRSMGVACATFLSLVILIASGYISTNDLTLSLRLSPFYLFESVFVPIALTVVLFIGPIVVQYREGILFILETDELSPFYTVLRNYIIGPLSEEYVYRFLMTAVLIQCYSYSSTIFITSILFSLSHIHHYIEKIITGRDPIDWPIAILHLLQTFIFACYACILYLRSQSVFSLFVVHSFCNWMGAPRLDPLFADKNTTIITVLGLISCIGFTFLYVGYL